MNYHQQNTLKYLHIHLHQTLKRFFNGIKSSQHSLHTFNQNKTKNLILLLQNYLQWPQPIQPRNDPCADKYIQWVKDFNLESSEDPLRTFKVSIKTDEEPM